MQIELIQLRECISKHNILAAKQQREERDAERRYQRSQARTLEFETLARLQGRIKGVITRMRLRRLKQAAIRIQRCWRRWRDSAIKQTQICNVLDSFGSRKSFLLNNSSSAPHGVLGMSIRQSVARVGRMSVAAGNIQRVFRGFRERVLNEMRAKAVVKIQACFRGALVRAEVRKFQTMHLAASLIQFHWLKRHAIRETAALSIQAAFRGFCFRALLAKLTAKCSCDAHQLLHLRKRMQTGLVATRHNSPLRGGCNGTICKLKTDKNNVSISGVRDGRAYLSSTFRPTKLSPPAKGESLAKRIRAHMPSASAGQILQTIPHSDEGRLPACDQRIRSRLQRAIQKKIIVDKRLEEERLFFDRVFEAPKNVPVLLQQILQNSNPNGLPKSRPSKDRLYKDDGALVNELSFVLNACTKRKGSLAALIQQQLKREQFPSSSTNSPPRTVDVSKMHFTPNPRIIRANEASPRKEKLASGSAPPGSPARKILQMQLEAKMTKHMQGYRPTRAVNPKTNKSSPVHDAFVAFVESNPHTAPRQIRSRSNTTQRVRAVDTKKLQKPSKQIIKPKHAVRSSPPPNLEKIPQKKEILSSVTSHQTPIFQQATKNLISSTGSIFNVHHLPPDASPTSTHHYQPSKHGGVIPAENVNLYNVGPETNSHNVTGNSDDFANHLHNEADSLVGDILELGGLSEDHKDTDFAASLHAGAPSRDAMLTVIRSASESCAVFSPYQNDLVHLSSDIKTEKIHAEFGRMEQKLLADKFRRTLQPSKSFTPPAGQRYSPQRMDRGRQREQAKFIENESLSLKPVQMSNVKKHMHEVFENPLTKLMPSHHASHGALASYLCME